MHKAVRSQQTWHSGLVVGSEGNFRGRFKMLSNVVSRLLPLQAYVQTIYTNTKPAWRAVTTCHREKNTVSKSAVTVCVRQMHVLVVTEHAMNFGLPEWCEAIHQFIHENAKGPPVNSAAVTIAIDDLRRQILFCAHKGVGACVRLCHQQVCGGVQRALQTAPESTPT